MLGTVKNEFGKFGDLLDKTRKKLDEASQSIDVAATKSRTIERKLRTVQELPSATAKNAVGNSPVDDEEAAATIKKS